MGFLGFPRRFRRPFRHFCHFYPEYTQNRHLSSLLLDSGPILGFPGLPGPERARFLDFLGFLGQNRPDSCSFLGFLGQNEPDSVTSGLPGSERARFRHLLVIPGPSDLRDAQVDHHLG